MKVSISLTLLILAVGASFGWRDHQRLATARERHARLAAEAIQSGLTRDLSRSQSGKRVTKREHEDKLAAAKRIASDFIIAGKNSNRAEAMPDSLSELLTQVASLDIDQLKILFTEVLASNELTDEVRQRLVFNLAEVASDNPPTALALLTDSLDLARGAGLDKALVSLSLKKWAKEDPLAVLAWVHRNGDLFSKLMDEDDKNCMVGSAAEKHPSLALKLVDKLGLKGSSWSSPLDYITRAPKNAEERNATLTAITAHLAALPAGKDKEHQSEVLITGIMINAAQDGFDAGTKWLDHGGFTREQLQETINSNLVWVTKLDETGKWAEWLGKTNTGEKTNFWIKEMVRSWAEKDYLAAGKWLASSPGGPVKDISISAFAKSVSGHNPEAAAQWAMTLPPGNERDDTLRTIYKEWPTDDKAAKEAFAKTHGLK